MGLYIVVAIEALQEGRILDFTSYPACSHVHLGSSGEFALLLNSIHRLLLCSHEFSMVVNVQENPVAEWGA